MLNIWFALALIFIIADWWAVWNQRTRINFFTKPTALLMLFIWFQSVAGMSHISTWFGLGLFFSLAGDMFLLFSSRYFIYGMAAFLLAHVSYIIGFSFPLPFDRVLYWVTLLAAMSAALVVITVLYRHLKLVPAFRKIKVVVGLYAVTICFMLFSAVWTLSRSDWDLSAAACAAGGAFLFFISDLVLAYDCFIRPFPRARIIVRITYHLGQLALCAGVILFTA